MSITSTGNERGATDRRTPCGAWEPFELREADGARVAVARKGRGPVVLGLHATGHGARDFEGLAARLEDTHEVIAVDWPGQGRSPAEEVPASAARYSRIAEALLPQLTRDPVVVVGCSIGGAAAIDLASRRPDLVRGLVLCDPGGLLPVDASVRFGTRAMSAFFAAGARGARWYPKAFELYYRLVLPAPAARPWRDRIVAAAVETAPVLAEAWASFGRPEADLRGKLGLVACPVLLAWASSDRVLPWSRCRAAATAFRDARLELFDGGHAAFLEDPVRFEEVFRGFVSSLPDAEAGPGDRSTWNAAGAG